MRFAWVAMVLMIAGSSTAVAQTRVQAEEPVRSSDAREATEATEASSDDDEADDAEEAAARENVGDEDFDWDALELDGYSAAERAE